MLDFKLIVQNFYFLKSDSILSRRV